MKTHAILLIGLPILVISFVINEKCVPCTWKKNLHCGKEPNGGCMVTAINKCTVELISCLREDKGLKPFTEIVEGKCPKGKRKCLPLPSPWPFL